MSKRLKQLNKQELWAGIWVLAALFFMLFVYAPTELYCYNMDEFWFDYYNLLSVMAMLFLGGMLLAVVVAVTIWFLAPKVYRFAGLPFLCIVFLCTYVQGNFLVSNLPPMDGSIPDWDNYRTEMNQSLILWIVVTVSIILLYCVIKSANFVKVAKIMSVCMLLMFGVTTASVLLMTEGYKPKPDACSTVKDQYVYSEDENYIIFVLDSVDAGTLSQMMEENPEYKEIFADFTFYENMMGAYSCTGVAIPHILSGVWYENKEPLSAYEVESYNNSPIINTMEQEGYKLGMYEFEMPYKDDKVYRFSNVLNADVRVNSYLNFAKLEIKLIGLRYAPYQLKEKCLFNTSYFVDLWERADDGDPAFVAENKAFYDRLQTTEITTVPEKCFKFVHIEGGHVPFQYDENVNVVENGTYRDSLKATLTITKAYLDKLKEAGVYDNSSIVIMADHGYAEEFGFVEGVDACEWRQNPIFFAKAQNEHHDMMVSQAPVSYADLQDAFVKLMNAESGGDIFEYAEGDSRERRYIYYDFVFDEYMYEYTSEGHAADDKSMELTGNEYIREE